MKIKYLTILMTAAALLILSSRPLHAQGKVELDFDLVEGKAETEPVASKPKKLSKRELKKIEGSWSNEYLDTVNVSKTQVINDYSMIGVQYGAALSQVIWNPSTTQGMVLIPWNVGVMYTRYGKMFNFMPYFGFQLGVFYTQEGFQLKAQANSTYVPSVTGTGESSARMNVIEVPLLAHCHIDFWKMKAIVNVGLYGGYRLSIHREGNYVKSEYVDSFAEYNNRVDWGVKGGLGFGFIFDPVEIHIQATYKHSFASLYEPDYNSEYYYRYAYPSNIILSVGLHFQLTKRTGKTSSMLKKEAREMVYGSSKTK